MDQSTKLTFTFVNLSHPDEMRDQEVVNHVRCSAMTSFGRTKRKRRPKKANSQVTFEVGTAGCLAPSTMSPSSVGLPTMDASVLRQSDMEIKASRRGSDSK
jgi:hypothetical protein